MDEPDDLSDEIKKLEERKAHLEDVRASYLKAQDVLPYIQENIDITDWQIRAYKNLPPEASEIPKPNRTDELELENQYLRGVFTVLNIPSEPQLHSSTSVTISGGTIDYSYIDRVRDIGTPSAIEYGNSFILEYNQLQDVQQRPRQVRDRLEKIGGENLLERFNTANKTYLAFRNGSGNRTAAANDMRNLLLGFKGDLFNLARRFPKENMTWDTMSARLAINGGRGTEHMVLSTQNTMHSSLLARLADVLKDREGGSITNLDSIWTETLDHLYTVLGLIELKS
jgi:hypothetical protein